MNTVGTVAINEGYGIRGVYDMSFKNKAGKLFKLLQLSFNSFLKSHQPGKGSSYPTADGTFIQLDMTGEWDDAKWLKEFYFLREAGMHYLIVMGTAFTEGNVIKTAYPTNLPDCSMFTKKDIIDTLLRNAEAAGMKVFLGINFNEEWWKKAASDPEWLFAQMQRDNMIADELYRLYHYRYPGAFYGWYWMYEVDNMNFKSKKQFKILAKAISIQLDFLSEHHERLPFMLSPFMNLAYACPGRYGNGWAYLFKHTGLGDGDVFCPQDSVGGGGVGLQDVGRWFAAFRRAVDKKPGLLLWANTECFDHKTWSSAPVGRFIRQMENEKPYVDNLVTFAYSHYYSPNNINPGYHRTYVDYVRTGKLDCQRPDAPETVEIERLDEKCFKISWTPAKDNIGVCGYILYRNGIPVFRTEVQRSYGGSGEGPVTTYMDVLSKKPGSSGITYEARAFDFAGNISIPGRVKKISGYSSNNCFVK